MKKMNYISNLESLYLDINSNLEEAANLYEEDLPKTQQTCNTEVGRRPMKTKELCTFVSNISRIVVGTMLLSENPLPAKDLKDFITKTSYIMEGLERLVYHVIHVSSNCRINNPSKYCQLAFQEDSVRRILKNTTSNMSSTTYGNITPHRIQHQNFHLFGH